MTYTRYLKKIINKEIKLKPELHIIRTGMVLGKTKICLMACKISTCLHPTFRSNENMYALHEK